MTRRRVAWFHCFSGIAGDMALGACLDAGADVDAVRALLDGLDLPGWALRVEPVWLSWDCQPSCGAVANRPCRYGDSQRGRGSSPSITWRSPVSSPRR